jgi:hypothetical protein
MINMEVSREVFMVRWHRRNGGTLHVKLLVCLVVMALCRYGVAGIRRGRQRQGIQRVTTASSGVYYDEACSGVENVRGIQCGGV